MHTLSDHYKILKKARGNSHFCRRASLMKAVCGISALPLPISIFSQKSHPSEKRKTPTPIAAHISSSILTPPRLQENIFAIGGLYCLILQKKTPFTIKRSLFATKAELAIANSAFLSYYTFLPHASDFTMDFKYPKMKGSMSPSITASTFPTSTWVRWSFTIL